MIRVRGFQPMSVAVVSHHDGRPHLGVVVKTAYAIPPPGGSRAEMAPPPPMRGDEPISWPGLGAGELAHASDLAPRKARADVLLVGHASGAAPATALPIRFTVGPVRRELVAVASAPAVALPLVAEHLRAHPPGEPTVGPQRPSGARLRRPRRAGRAEAPWGAMMLDVATGDDGSGHQVAPREQQVPLPFPAGAQIVLSGLGLGSGGAERWFWLPAVTPVAFVRAGAAVEAVPLVCDTIEVDVDAGVVTLLHRGRYSGAVGDLEILVGLAGEGTPRTAADVMAQHASSRPLAHVTLGPAGEPLVIPAPDVRDEPSHDLASFASDASATAAIDVSKLVSQLPFDRAGAMAAPPAPVARAVDDDDDDAGPSTAMVDASRLGASLPFAARGTPEPAPRSEVTAAIPVAHLAGFDEAPGETRPIPVVTAPATPFEAAPASSRGAAPPAAPSALVPPPVVPTPPPSAPGAMAVPAPPPSSAWVRPGAPLAAPMISTPAPIPPAPPSAPSSAAREPEQAPIGRAPLTAEELADLQVELESSPRHARRAILARHELDVVAWAQESARWAARLEAEAARGDSRTLDVLLARARVRREQQGDGGSAGR